jgi:hypothetical protein
MIVLQYDGACIKCGQKLERGQWALYGRGVGILCLDCHVTKFGDKALVAKYLKSRDLKQIINALTVEADRLAEKVEAFQGYEKLIALYENQKRMTELVTKYLTEKIAQPDEREAFGEILLCKKEAEERIKDMEEYLKRLMDRKKLKWIKKTSEAQEA